MELVAHASPQIVFYVSRLAILHYQFSAGGHLLRLFVESIRGGVLRWPVGGYLFQLIDVRTVNAEQVLTASQACEEGFGGGFLFLPRRGGAGVRLDTVGSPDGATLISPRKLIACC